MKVNYNELMKEEISNLTSVPSLLLHSCCGPCSSYVISRLTNYFNITVLYYNPNIEPKEEYEKRKSEQLRFIKEYKPVNKIDFIDCDYDNDAYENVVKGHENDKEGGNRCHICYRLRLEKTATIAKENNFDYFCTTLTVSPYKNTEVLNTIGKELEKKYDVKYLVSDFKKEEGYKISIEMSKEYNLYRQDYCGCNYSNWHNISE